MLLFLIVDGIRVRILLESTFNFVLLQMSLSFYGDGLAVTCRFLCTSALRIVLSKDVTEFILVSFRVRSVVGVDAHLVIKVEDAFVAHVEMLGHANLLPSGFYLGHGLVEEDARGENDHLC